MSDSINLAPGRAAVAQHTRVAARCSGSSLVGGVLVASASGGRDKPAAYSSFAWLICCLGEERQSPKGERRAYSSAASSIRTNCAPSDATPSISRSSMSIRWPRPVTSGWKV